jgi:Fic family protein
MHLLEGLIDDKTLRILKVFYKDPGEYHHINQASVLSGVSLATTFRSIQKLSRLGWLEVRKISKLKIYRLAKSRDTKELRRVICED